MEGRFNGGFFALRVWGGVDVEGLIFGIYVTVTDRVSVLVVFVLITNRNVHRLRLIMIHLREYVNRPQL